MKPANLLITRFGEPALADFGLAVLSETRDQSITLELTPAYAAPEMFHQGRPAPESDVYALCATLYALMRGRPARWREGHNPTLLSLVDMFAEPVPEIPNVPADLIVLLRRGMANDPKVRPSAAELRDELEGVVRDPDPTMIMRPVGPLIALGSTPPPWPTPPQRPTPTPRYSTEDEPTQPSDAGSADPRSWLALTAGSSVGLVLAQDVLCHEVEDHLAAHRSDPARADPT